jgi:hypothetical protein
MTTTTGDLEGAVSPRRAGNVAGPARGSARSISGEIMQMPPMYSALKHAGKPLYVYARAGTEIARDPSRSRFRTDARELRRHRADDQPSRAAKALISRVWPKTSGKRSLWALRWPASDARSRALQRGGRIHTGSAGEVARKSAWRTPSGRCVARRAPILRTRRGQRLTGSARADRRLPEGLTPGCRLYGPDQAFLGLARSRAWRCCGLDAYGFEAVKCLRKRGFNE